MSMYKTFQTNSDLEKAGIVLDYGDFRVTVARAGGSNKNFSKVLEFRTRPVKRAIQTETLPLERQEEIMMEVYAQAVIIDWEVKSAEGVWSKGIENEDGDIIPVTTENLVDTFKKLPDLFKDIQEQSNKAVLFRKQIDLEDSKN